MPRMVTPYAVQLAPWSLAESDRDAWLALRRDGLGGSDMPAVVSMDDSRLTRWGVYLSKVAPELGGEDADDDSRFAEMAWFGHQMEAVAAQWFRAHHPGTRVSRLGMIASKADPWMRVNLDYLVSGCPDGRCVIEVKNRSAWAASQWDEAGDVEKIPDAAVIQAMWGLIVLGGPAASYGHAHLLIVIGGNELREYRVDYDSDLAEVLTSEARWFWHEHVLRKIPPPVDASERTGQILARMWDVDEGAILTADDATVDLVDRLRAADAAAELAADDAKLVKHELMAVMGDREILLAPDGRKLATWKQNSTFRDGAFQAEQPAAFASYARTRDVTDTKLLAEKEPALYRQYRARQFRLAPAPKDAK